jgi:hypothetical protein
VRDWAILATPWGFHPEDVKVPVRLFHGGIDDRVPLHYAEHLAWTFPGAHLAVHPGEGHMIIFERAEEFLSALARCDTDRSRRKSSGGRASGTHADGRRVPEEPPNELRIDRGAGLLLV